MEYTRTRQKIESILISLKRDILILSIKKHKLTTNSYRIIQTLDNQIPRIVAKMREIFNEDFDLEIAKEFNLYIKGILEKTLDNSRLDRMIGDEEEEVISHLKNQFVEITRKIQDLVKEEEEPAAN